MEFSKARGQAITKTFSGPDEFAREIKRHQAQNKARRKRERIRQNKAREHDFNAYKITCLGDSNHYAG